MAKLPHNPPKICKVCGGWTYKDLSLVYKKCECEIQQQNESDCVVSIVIKTKGDSFCNCVQPKYNGDYYNGYYHCQECKGKIAK